jgi:hypothetical protein
MALAAAGADFELGAQMEHRRRAVGYGLANLAIGNVIAYTDDHQCLLLLSR